MIKKFSLPDYYGKCNLIVDIFNLRNNHPEYFYFDRIIDSCYGAPPDLIWTGGRKVFYEDPISMDEVLNMLPYVELRHVCTNFFIDNEIIHDYRSNLFIRNYVRSQDKVIIYHPTLIQYFKKTYPHIPLIYSTTMDITNINKINELTENNIYVLNYNYNYDDKYLKQLKNLHNIEILCGEPCELHCPNRIRHYQFVSQAALLGQIPDDTFSCPYGAEARSGYDIIHLPHAITQERIEQLSEMGIQYFKISGRTLPPPDWIYVIAYYLILPEYREKVISELVHKWW